MLKEYEAYSLAHPKKQTIPMVTVKSGLFIVALVTSLRVPAETCFANDFDLYGYG